MEKKKFALRSANESKNGWPGVHIDWPFVAHNWICRHDEITRYVTAWIRWSHRRIAQPRSRKTPFKMRSINKSEFPIDCLLLVPPNHADFVFILLTHLQRSTQYRLLHCRWQSTIEYHMAPWHFDYIRDHSIHTNCCDRMTHEIHAKKCEMKFYDISARKRFAIHSLRLHFAAESISVAHEQWTTVVQS